jgi:methionyl-tRNA formyltransferase
MLHVPGSEAVLCKIGEVRVSESSHDESPGSIISDGRTFLSVVTGDGSLDVLEIQQAGKRSMNTDEFLRGLHGGISGSVFE